MSIVFFPKDEASPISQPRVENVKRKKRTFKCSGIERDIDFVGEDSITELVYYRKLLTISIASNEVSMSTNVEIRENILK